MHDDVTIQMKALLFGAIYFSKFHKMKFGDLVETCFWLNLAVKGLNKLSSMGSKEIYCIRIYRKYFLRPICIQNSTTLHKTKNKFVPLWKGDICLHFKMSKRLCV